MESRYLLISPLAGSLSSFGKLPQPFFAAMRFKPFRARRRRRPQTRRCHLRISGAVCFERGAARPCSSRRWRTTSGKTCNNIGTAFASGVFFTDMRDTWFKATLWSPSLWRWGRGYRFSADDDAAYQGDRFDRGRSRGHRYDKTCFKLSACIAPCTHVSVLQFGGSIRQRGPSSPLRDTGRRLLVEWTGGRRSTHRAGTFPRSRWAGRARGCAPYALSLVFQFSHTLAVPSNGTAFSLHTRETCANIEGTGAVMIF